MVSDALRAAMRMVADRFISGRARGRSRPRSGLRSEIAAPAIDAVHAAARHHHTRRLELRPRSLMAWVDLVAANEVIDVAGQPVEMEVRAGHILRRVALSHDSFVNRSRGRRVDVAKSRRAHELVDP